jgi:hypothetical protein
MTTLTRTWLGRAVFIAGAVGLGLFAAIFFVTADRGKGLLYTGGFLMVGLAVALAATAELRQRHARLAFKPQTTPGWWAVWLEVAAAVFAVVAPTVLDALRPALENVPFRLFNTIVLGFALAIAAGVTAAVAWFRKAERSLLVLLTMFPALFALFFLLGELLAPH